MDFEELIRPQSWQLPQIGQLLQKLIGIEMIDWNREGAWIEI
jgi:hypothetical protein